MKILYIPGYYPFCFYYRGYLPGVYSNQMVVGDFMRMDLAVDEVDLARNADQADVIVFQRPSSKSSLDLARLLKQKGKKIIFENDDTYSAVPIDRLGNQKYIDVAREQNDNLNQFLKEADGAITSTETLKEEYEKINPNIVVLKNCIDPLDEFPCKKNDTGKFRIGIIGSVATNDDYVHVMEDIKKIDEEGKATFVVLGLAYKEGKVAPIYQPDFDFWASLKNVEWHEPVHVTEYMSTVANLALDLVIIPRRDDYFNYCKSNLKFLEMSLLKIPVLAQSFPNGKSPYEADKDYLTLTNDAWYESISRVMNDYAPFKALAEKAHDYVLEHYNIASYSKEWTKAIHHLCKYQQNT